MVKAYRMKTQAGQPVVIRKVAAVLNRERCLVLMGVTDNLWTVVNTETSPGSGDFSGWTEQVAFSGGAQMLHAAAADHGGEAWTGWGIDQNLQPTRFRGADWDGEGAPWLKAPRMSAIAAAQLFGVGAGPSTNGSHFGLQAFGVGEDYTLLTALQDRYVHPFYRMHNDQQYPAPNGSQSDKAWGPWTVWEGAPRACAVAVAPYKGGQEGGVKWGGRVWILDLRQRLHMTSGAVDRWEPWSGPDWNGAPRLRFITATPQKHGTVVFGIDGDNHLVSCSQSWEPEERNFPTDNWSAWSDSHIPKVETVSVAATLDANGLVWAFAVTPHGEVMTNRQTKINGNWGVWQPTQYMDYYR